MAVTTFAPTEKPRLERLYLDDAAAGIKTLGL